MKYRLLDILHCPECWNFPLNLEIFKKQGFSFEEKIENIKCANLCAFEKDGNKKDCNVCYSEEIDMGVLFCNTCHKCYPIIEGIPRFNPDWYEDFPQFIEMYKNELSKRVYTKWMPEEFKEFKRFQGATKKSFGFQWLRYEVTDREEDIKDFFSKTGITSEFLERKLILDAGCGMGRFLMVSTRSDNEVIGIDLSASIERAYKITKNLPFVHIIQGDLMRPPFREEAFDFIYSIGVLHHTPNTKKAFKSISRLVKKKGRISIWVYQLWVSPELKVKYKRVFAKIQELIFNNVRKITTRLPHKLLHYLCYIAIPLGWFQMQIRKNIYTKIFLWPFLLIVVNNHKKKHIRLLDTFDWYSPKYQWKHTYDEVFGWFSEEKFEGIEKTLSHPVGVTAIKQ
jgi:SAM-dependent methyltransferase/uncharacterized protein YbaR (Trm112 family)